MMSLLFPLIASLAIGITGPRAGTAECGYCDTCHVNPNNSETATGCQGCHNDKSSTDGKCVYGGCDNITNCGGGETFNDTGVGAVLAATGDVQGLARLMREPPAGKFLELSYDRQAVLVRSSCGAIIGVVPIEFNTYAALQPAAAPKTLRFEAMGSWAVGD